ncbi:MAG: hypothetical protein CL402_06165 [Acidiferrobacteraceae bacterium]|nr:hypothetical protein [Acidiferrobacteraceae bacterium]|tara:strand:- start:1129 stop:1926 length:798 start_codon:yes stop_codon:yes gene_type:complete
MKIFIGIVGGLVLLNLLDLREYATPYAYLIFAFIAAVGWTVYTTKPWTWRKKDTDIGGAIVGMGLYIVIGYFVIALVVGLSRLVLSTTYGWYVVGVLVLLVVLIQLLIQLRRRRRNWEEFLGSPLADMEKNHVYFEDRITTPTIEYLTTEPLDWVDEVEGYYLIDEGVLHIYYDCNHFDGHYVNRYVSEWGVSSEEDAELVFDMFIDSERESKKVWERDVGLEYRDEFYEWLTAEDIEFDPDDPEWDWGGTHLDRAHKFLSSGFF